MWDNISVSKWISENGRKGQNFIAGKNFAIVTEKLKLMLSTLSYNPANNCIQDTGKVKGDKQGRQRKEINV
jgi:hypothetical protein